MKITLVDKPWSLKLYVMIGLFKALAAKIVVVTVDAEN